MAQNPIKVAGRATLAMTGVGLGVGISLLFAWEWAEWAVRADIAADEWALVEPVIPLVFLMIGTLGSAIVGGIIGIFEGLRSTERQYVLYVALGCFLGAILMVFIIGIFTSFTGGNGDDDGPVTALELVSLAGLAGFGSAIASSFTAKFGAK